MNQNRNAGQSVGSTLTGQAKNRAGSEAFHPQHTMPPAPRQAPSGAIAARLVGDVIYIGPRNVAAVRGGALQRTFDAQTELLRGCALSFRVDVLRLAQDAGARRIEAKERNTGDVYTIGMSDFCRLAWAFAHPAYGAQLALDLKRWAKADPRAEYAQLDLFGGAI